MNDDKPYPWYLAFAAECLDTVLKRNRLHEPRKAVGAKTAHKGNDALHQAIEHHKKAKRRKQRKQWIFKDQSFYQEKA